MPGKKPPTRLSVLIPMPVSLVLGILFFMPWLNISCDTEHIMKEVQSQEGFGAAPPIPFGSQEIAHASGWDLAGGQISVENPSMSGNQSFNDENRMLKQRPWLYICLAGPIAIALLCAAAVSGTISTRAAGKGMMVLGVIGVALMIAASTIDYVDDAMDKAKQEAAKSGATLSCPALDQSMGEAKDGMKEFIKTETTGHLWISVGLHSLIVICGLGACGDPPQYGAANQVTFRGDMAVGSSPIIADGPASTPNFGPDLNARQPRTGTPSTTETQNPSSR